MSYKTSSKIQWLGLFALGLGYSLIYLDITALNIALPTIQSQFCASNTELFWINGSYTLGVATTSLAGGRLGDILGIRRVYLFGLFLFGLSSLVAGASLSAPFLIIMRAFQGVGGAITLATAMSAIYHLFPPEKQGRAMGIFGLSSIFFILVGPAIGGYFTEYLSWRWIFWINPIVGVVSFLVIFIILKGIDEDRHKEAKFDTLGQLLFMAFLVPLIIALMQGENWGWLSAAILSLFGISLFFFLSFIYYELRKKHPLFDLSLFKKINFRIAMVIFIAMQFPLASTMYNALYLQYGLGFDAVKAGVALVPPSLISFVSNPMAGRLVDKYGYKPILRFGLVLATFAFLWLAVTANVQKYIFLAIGIFLTAVAMPLVFVPAFMMVMRSSAANQKGMISGTVITMRQTGGSICVALMAVITATLHSRLEDKVSHSEMFVRSFQLVMALVTAVMLIGLISSFWIDRYKSDSHLDPNTL